jgi:hypothetical protein
LFFGGKMMHKSKFASSLVGALLVLGTGISARAETLNMLDFTGYATASDSQLQTYIATELGSAVKNVTLTGAEGGGVPCGGSATGDCLGGTYNGNVYYTGDGHVVGPGNGSSSYTLANKDGGFIINNNVSGGGSSYINLQFTLTGGATAITGLAFDYEIFPNDDCSIYYCPGTAGDISVSNAAGGGTVDWSNVAVEPGKPGGSTYTKSPASNPETNPQLIGSVDLTSGLSNLCKDESGSYVCDISFNDWPPTIGIEDVVITTNTDPVPEPTSIILLGTILSIVMFKMRRRRQA